MMIPWLRLLPYGIGLAALVAGFFYVKHLGYASAEANYKPILAGIEQQRIKAEARVKAIETASAAINQDTENRHVETEKQLRARSDAAGMRITGLMRQLAADRHFSDLPEDAAPPGFTEPETDESRRFVRAGESVVRVGAGCEVDAETIVEFQRWYGEQSANFLKETP